MLKRSKKTTKKLKTILKRGKINNQDEYELVHSRIDELIHNVPEDDPGKKDIDDLDRILTEYSIAEIE